ncbi:MAG: heparan-alpha-glucosaminide N-acetyltransferase [Pseudomonadota bacterium]
MAARDVPREARTPLVSMRWVLLDRARGFALLAMIVYHALWDGFLFELLTPTLERDAAMRLAAQFIAGLFLVISGVSAALTAGMTRASLFKARHYWRRFAILCSAAALVSAATFIALPDAPIYFGILHHIAFASLVLATLQRLHPFVPAALAAFVVIVDDTVAAPIMDNPLVIWLGLGTRAPITADWVPVFPWMAASLLGYASGRQWIVPWLRSKPGRDKMAEETRTPARFYMPDILALGGRHSLAIYLIHQPILIGIIQLYLLFN